MTHSPNYQGIATFPLLRELIRDFSKIAQPLTSLLRGKPRQLLWDPNAQEALNKLKRAFITAPILRHPDPSRPFVEVDASEAGVVAILFQRIGDRPKLHPVAFFSQKLSPAERNYDVGNRELLAIKLTLEEWRHWLEGAIYPFLIYTDHKNLGYLRTAKQLIPRQARWSLFLSRFQFTLSYRPGTMNTKANALSRIHSPESWVNHEDYIVPPSCIVGAIEWVLYQTLTRFPRSRVPTACPPGKQFVPKHYRLELVTWAHTPLSTGHPAARCTYQMLAKKYW